MQPATLPHPPAGDLFSSIDEGEVPAGKNVESLAMTDPATSLQPRGQEDFRTLSACCQKTSSATV